MLGSYKRCDYDEIINLKCYFTIACDYQNERNIGGFPLFDLMKQRREVRSATFAI